MKFNQIKAFVHRNRIADVLNALMESDFKHIAICDVQGMLTALDRSEQRYSVELGQKVIDQVKLEIFCETGERTLEAVNTIRTHAQTGQDISGWIYVTGVTETFMITG